MNIELFNKCYDLAYDELVLSHELLEPRFYYKKVCQARISKLPFKIFSEKTFIKIIKSQLLSLNFRGNAKCNKQKNNKRLEDKSKSKSKNNTKDEDLSKYGSLLEFKTKNYKLYKYCRLNDILYKLCKKYNWELHEWDKIAGYVYYIKIISNNQIYFKIGLSSNVENRIEGLLENIENIENVEIILIKKWKFNRYNTALKYERLLHKKFNDKRNKNLIILKNGNSEIYFEDILNLDK